MAIKLIAFPTTTIAAKPLREIGTVLITSLDAGTMVDGLSETWFGQCIALGATRAQGKEMEGYAEIASEVGKAVESIRTEAHAILDERDADAAKRLAGEDYINAKERVDNLRIKVNNNLKSAKSVIVNAIKQGEEVMAQVRDGGHILWRHDGTARGKTELQNLLKAVKEAARTPKSDLEKALESAAVFARRLCQLSDAEQTDVLKSFDTYYQTRRESVSEAA